jgi:hypothetical protein
MWPGPEQLWPISFVLEWCSRATKPQLFFGPGSIRVRPTPLSALSRFFADTYDSCDS